MSECNELQFIPITNYSFREPHQPEGVSTPGELQNMFHNPYFLPTHDQIKRAFPFWWDWNNFCLNEKNPVFEFLNEEYLNALSTYLVTRIKELDAIEDKPVVILEIGAGNGRLSYFLQQKLEKMVSKNVKVLATDSDEWKLTNRLPVEQLEHDKAIEKYHPDIVICSWMPYRQDFSKDIRKFNSVKEYILIGEPDGGCCWDEWETWGKPRLMENDDEGGRMVPPYKADGFERYDLFDLNELQICRNDSPGNYSYSATVSFRRKN